MDDHRNCGPASHCLLVSCPGWAEPTPEELARGLAGAFDSPSMHVFDSWTDGDLYRAIQTEPPGPGHAAAVAEYVEELRSRQARQEEQAALEARLREQYQI